MMASSTRARKFKASFSNRVPNGPVRGTLFLCVHNAVRSQMAEGWARKLLLPDMTAWSAGSGPADAVDPRAVEVMQEVGLDISAQRPKRISDVPLSRADIVVTLCAEEVCVGLPGLVRRENWILPDPAAAQGDPQQVLAEFRRIRDELQQRIAALAGLLDSAER
jgi:arsenate reductase